MSAPPDRISEQLHSMLSCISDVKAWATANMLRLNDNKKELMLVTSKRTKHLHNLPTFITIGNAQIPFKQSVKNLGFTLDCHLTMNAHVSKIARTCYFKLRHLAYIRRFLTSTATITLVSAFVLSRMDYCKSLLFGSTHDVTSHLPTGYRLFMNDTHSPGVGGIGFVISPRCSYKLISSEFFSTRIGKLVFDIRRRRIHILSIYAPTAIDAHANETMSFFTTDSLQLSMQSHHAITFSYVVTSTQHCLSIKFV